MAEVKFCGLTRAADARAAVRLGASHVGVIFAGGPRMLAPEQAQAVLHDVPVTVRRVGVFGHESPGSIGVRALAAGVDIVQLHGDPDPAFVHALRPLFAGPIWAVLRVAGETLPAGARELFEAADAVVLDARSERGLGGTGMTLPWAKLAGQLSGERVAGRLVLAGGLSPANVAAAVDALHPDIVDVSSGVEASPGVKDHSLMSAFMEAARSSPRAA